MTTGMGTPSGGSQSTTPVTVQYRPTTLHRTDAAILTKMGATNVTTAPAAVPGTMPPPRGTSTSEEVQG